ncbi:SLC13 family permease [uncultured Corynebacterium sp.]|uniref:SLC13 family permease n=1 Tax=uncultured Corynebacterium sp. TaxID=159447 RepID=UPI0025DD09C0|nr:SLC13 family permease [uncultured Corynebacterium sp.]
MTNPDPRTCTSTSGSISAPENGCDGGVVKQLTCTNVLSDGSVHVATTPPPKPMPAVTDADPDEPGRRGAKNRLRSLPGPVRAVTRPAAAITALAMAAGIWALPAGFGFHATVTLAVFAVAVWLWTFTSVGDTYIALGAAVTLVLVGVIDAGVVFAALGEDVTWLLIGAFVISGAVAASGLGVRAAVFLAAGCRTPRGLVHVLTLAVVATAFAIPATSGRAALVLPVFVALAVALGPGRRWLVVVLSLSLPTVILLSAVGSYIGAGAHLITDQILARTGFGEIGYTGWLLVGMPLALTSSHLAAEIVLMAGSTRAQRRQRLDLSVADLAAGVPGGATVTGPLTIHESRSAIVLVAVVGLWSTDGLHGVHPAVIALLGALVITLPSWGPLGFGAALKQVPWSLLLFMAATLALGGALIDSGAAAGLTDIVASGAPGGAAAAPVFLAGVVVASAAAHLIIQSRSARSTVLVPIVVALAPAAGADPVIAAFASTSAAGFCHTLNSSAKPLAMFATVPAEREIPVFGDAYRLRSAALLVVPTIALIALFALIIWPAMGFGAGM